MALVKIEGNELELDDSICKSDKSLKDALAPFYPAVANADVKRETKGERTVITVTKRAGSKGCAEVIAALAASKETISPVLVLDVLGWEKAKPAAVEEAVIKALDDERLMKRSINTLDEATPQPSNFVPVGF